MDTANSIRFERPFRRQDRVRLAVIIQDENAITRAARLDSYDDVAGRRKSRRPLTDHNPGRLPKIGHKNVPRIGRQPAVDDPLQHIRSWMARRPVRDDQHSGSKGGEERLAFFPGGPRGCSSDPLALRMRSLVRRRPEGVSHGCDAECAGSAGDRRPYADQSFTTGEGWTSFPCRSTQVR